jgi:hypothetical protein
MLCAREFVEGLCVGAESNNAVIKGLMDPSSIWDAGS